MWLVVPSRLLPAGLGGAAGGSAGKSVDLPVERVIARLPDGREALGSFTLRMRADGTPGQLRAIAARTPTRVPADDAPLLALLTPVTQPGSADSLVRERVTSAMTGLSYQQTAGEPGKGCSARRCATR